MTTEPITCIGNDLAAVCADIRLRGGCIEAMDVIGKAMYRVSYFVSAWRNIQTRPLIGSINRCTGTHRRDEISPASVCHAGENPAALTTLRVAENFERVGGVPNDTVESHPERVVGLCFASNVSRDNPAALKTVSGRSGLISEVTGKSEPERQMEEIPPAMVNPSISIEDRMAALQSKLLASGKIRRSKPKTEARLPHAD